ncbi:MAG: glycosyltransferase, partial [Aeriscardovia sp.]|nr:glycosyltransferase [Aeriscardovia sp.]
FDLLIEAFHIFAQQNDDWTLDIVGEGVEEPLYRNMIKEYQLEDRITIHPFTDHIQKYYSEAQVYVLSSRWEGMPLVLMEAMAHGLPIVASDLPICKEIMQDNCLYFSNGDVNGLARQMSEATRMDWRTRSGESIRIAQRFSVDAIIQQWHRLLGASVSSK